jgi:hypothetical protein
MSPSETNGANWWPELDGVAMTIGSLVVGDRIRIRSRSKEPFTAIVTRAEQRTSGQPLETVTLAFEVPESEWTAVLTDSELRTIDESGPITATFEASKFNSGWSARATSIAVRARAAEGYLNSDAPISFGQPVGIEIIEE